MGVKVRYLGTRPYDETLASMQRFTDERNAGTRDEMWMLQHPPVYTLGLGGKAEHILDPGAIPVIRSDRGGQVTFHGPGQLVAYVLVDLQRAGISLRNFVHGLEQATVDLLAELGVSAQRRPGAPGVYTGRGKIAALGLRIRRGCSYHGLSLNVNMDLSPFSGINPCGFPGLAVTQLADHGIHLDCNGTAARLEPHILRQLAPQRREAAGRFFSIQPSGRKETRASSHGV